VTGFTLVEVIKSEFLHHNSTVLADQDDDDGGSTISSQPSMSNTVIILVWVGLGLYFAAAALHGELQPVVMTIFHYFAMLPTFINILNTFAFCNVHDISWGTKGAEEQHEGKGAGIDETEGAGGDDGPQAAANLNDRALMQRRTEKQRRKEQQDRENTTHEFEAFRFQMISAWLTSNIAVFLFFQSEGAEGMKIFIGLMIVSGMQYAMP
jgi:chitin synthase